MGSKRIVGVIAFVFLMTMFLATSARSQQTTAGSFRGTVTDQTGGVIPGATVRITNPDTGFTRETITNETGFYVLPRVPLGLYDFTVTFQGFQTLVSEGARLQVNQDATVDFTLQPGAVTEQVTVTAQAALLNTTTATLGTVVERQKVLQLPLNGRQYTQLILLTPGAAPRNTGQHGAFEVLADIGAVSPAVNGQRPTANNFTLDGVENNELFFNFAAISPPPDAIEEFKVQSYMASGAFGRGPGANVNVSTRAGTNEIHGSVWEFLRNDALDATNFFINSADLDKPAFRFNQFGATAGGPIIKNKAWIFGYYESLRKSIGSTLINAIPTSAQIAGDLTGFNQAYDPETTAFIGTITGLDADGNTVTVDNFSRQPFANNDLSGSLDPLIQQVANRFYPAPNIAGAGPGDNNFINTENVATDYDQFGVRVDAVLPFETRFFSRFSATEADKLIPDGIPDNPTSAVSHFRQAVAGITRNFGPTTVLDLRGQFLRTTTGRFRLSDIDFINSTGISSIFPTAMGQPPFFPNFTPEGFRANPQGKFTPIGPFNNWEIQGSVTKLAGKHTITVGGSFMYTDALDDDNYGFVNFRPEETGNPELMVDPDSGELVRVNPDTGSGLASYLLGVPGNATREAGVTQLVLHGNYIGLYVDDQWRVTPKLTLTLGLRYDFSEPKKDKFNRQCTWDFFGSQPGPLTSGADPASASSYGVEGFTSYLCVPGAQESFFVPVTSTLGTAVPGLIIADKNNFSPRVSFAYRLSPNTVIRSGIGVFYEFNQSDFQTLQAIMGAWPYGQGAGILLGDNAPSVANPAPQFTIEKGLFPPFAPVTSIPTNLSFAVDPQNRTPYVTEWNLGVERSFGNDWLVAVRYLGSAGTKLGGAVIANSALSPGVGAVAPRRTIPQHGNTFLYHHNSDSSYNAGQLKVEKRFSQGLSFLLSYTYSKSIDIRSGETSVGGSGQPRPLLARDRKAYRGLSDYDLTHNFVLSYVYDLPFGQGKPYGGWQFTGILRLHNGFPFGITSGDSANVGATSQFPQLVGDVLPSGFNQTREQWFNTAALTEIDFTYGNLGRNVVREDGFQNFDFGILKRTNLTETTFLEFRSEFFNLFNKVNFAAPDGSIRSGDFGRISRTALGPDIGGNRVIQFGLKFVF